jgi:hypothetical protein
MEASFLPKETALVLERIPQGWYTASKATRRVFCFVRYRLSNLT